MVSSYHRFITLWEALCQFAKERRVNSTEMQAPRRRPGLRAKDMIFLIAMPAVMLVFASSGGQERPLAETRPVTFTLSMAEDPDSLDPHRSAASITEQVMLNVFDGLLNPTPDGGVEPGIAESYDISEDGLTYTFTLRPDVFFHNGEPVTPDDVRFTLNRLRGADGEPGLSSEFVDVTAVETPDDRTVVIRLSQPNSSFEKFLYRAILPAGYQDHATHPIGAGPYRFVEYIPQNRIVLERFEQYYGEVGDVERVVVRVITDADARLLALRSGEIDFTNVSPDRIGDVEDRFRVVRTPANSVFILGMNNAHAPLDDERVRQAINFAIDRQEIIDFVFNGFGVELASSMSPAMADYYDESLIGMYDTDLDAARALLAEAGYADGFPIELRVSSHNEIYTNAAQVIQQQLSRVGIEVRIQVIEWSMWLSDVYTTRNFETTLIDFTGKIDPYPVLRRYISDFGRNFLNHDSPQFDSVMERALRSTDPSERKLLYREAQAILARTVPAVFIADYELIFAMDDRFDGYTPYPFFFHDIAKLRYAR